MRSQPLDQAVDVVGAVSFCQMSSMILPTVLPSPLGRLGGHPGGVAEVLQQRAVEAVEDDEVGLVRVALALAGAAPEHLLEEDAGLDRAAGRR